MRRKLFRLGLSTAVIAAVAVPLLAGSVSAAPKPKVAVCHYDDDGITSPPKLLRVGSQNAANKHVANHKKNYGHEGDDFLVDATHPCPPLP